MQLFYHPEAAFINQKITFNKDESRHIVKVLRKNVGDLLELTNGRGEFFQSQIETVNQNRCDVILTTLKQQKPLSYKLHLAVAPTKINDRFEWFLEKATEIGISEITPIYCNNSERKKIKPERFEKIIQSAMKQSLNAFLPRLNPPVTFSEFIKNMSKSSFEKFIAHCETGEKKSLKSSLQSGKDVLILIGPEGDFDSSEIETALKNKFLPVSLGESRLRTETAAVVACHSVAFINES